MAILCRSFLGVGSVVFSGTQHGVRSSCGIVHDRNRFFENHVLPLKCFFFLSSLFFFPIWSIMKVYITVILVLLEQISYLGKFWFLRYGPKCSWPIRLQDFSINRRTLKLAVSHKEINEINWFLVCPSNSFLRNGSLGFSDFWHNGR